jgi:hypothetical protein
MHPLTSGFVPRTFSPIDHEEATADLVGNRRRTHEHRSRHRDRDTAFDEAYAIETAKLMLTIRGREQAVARCNESIAKGARSPGGSAFWEMVLKHITAEA